jgi:hypothetical protein
MSKVMHSGGGGGWGAKENGQCYSSKGLDSFAAKVIEGLRQFFQLLLIATHFFKGQWAIPLVNLGSDHHSIGVREQG